MHTDELSNWRSTAFFSSSAVWSSAFQWIEANAGSASEGYHHDFPDKNMFVRVMNYKLKDRKSAQYENHKRTIDLQYTIMGAEGIEYTPVHLLTARGKYVADNDYQLHDIPTCGYGRIDNFVGHFCILWPNDGHMPQLRVEGFQSVRKLVVKIPLSLF